MTTEEILSLLQNVKEQNNGYMACCPAHDDKAQSLSITTGEDGRTLLFCHAGCELNAILDEIDLKPKDLFLRNSQNPNEFIATYDYTDEDGKLLYQVIRKPGKKFSQRRPDGSGGWIYNLRGVERIPYRLSEVVKAVKAGKVVFIVEGEKDADNLKSLGLVATCNSGGAGKWLDPLSAHLVHFNGADVVILPDNDKPGRNHAEAVARSLRGIAAGVKIIELPGVPEKGDVSDWVAAGGIKERLTKIVKEASPLTPDDTTKPEPGIILANVVAESVDWLWQGYIPLGKLTVIDGDPGLGKSTLALDIAARVSTGQTMPDGSQGIEATGVVTLSAEDGLADTIKPRLDAGGADCSKIVALTVVPDAETGEDRPPVIPDDLDVIKRAIDRVNAKLLIVDPLMAYLSGDTKSNNDQDVRRVLHRVGSLAEETGAAVLVVRHLNKSGGGNAIYRGGGSIGIIGAARSGLLVAPAPEDENRRVLASIKSNLCRRPESLAFHLEDCNGTSRLVWEGISSHNANDLLITPTEQDSGVLAEAKEILSDILSAGPVSANEAKKQARNAGVSDATLRRAKEALGVHSRKDGLGSWLWEVVQPENLSALRTFSADQAKQQPELNTFEGVQSIFEDAQIENTKPQVRGEHAQDAQEVQEYDFLQ